MAKDWTEVVTWGIGIGAVVIPVTFWIISHYKNKRFKIIENSVGASAIEQMKKSHENLSNKVTNLSIKFENMDSRNTEKLKDIKEDVEQLKQNSSELDLLFKKAFFGDK